MIIVNFIKKAGFGNNQMTVVGIINEELDLFDDPSAIKSAINSENIKDNGIYRISLARTSKSNYDGGYKPPTFKVVSILPMEVNAETRQLEYIL